MDRSRGERSFSSLPGFAARLYDSLAQNKAIRLQYKEIAQDLTSRIEKGRLLDVGTGPGYLLLEINKLNPDIKLFGLDVSEAMLNRAVLNLQGCGVDLRQGNISSSDYESNSFDLVTCSGSFYLWDKPLEGLEEIYRILINGGSANLYETHRDIDRNIVQDCMRENLKGESLLQRILAPRFFLRQLGMTYSRSELVELLAMTRFANQHSVVEITLAGIPAWLRIELYK